MSFFSGLKSRLCRLPVLIAIKVLLASRGNFSTPLSPARASEWISLLQRHLVAVTTEVGVAMLNATASRGMSKDPQRVERPWGWYEDLLEAEGYKVKRFLVFAGQQLSLQRHQHRSENWTVVSGQGQLLCKNTWHDAQAGTTLYIPRGALHRARGGQSDLVVVEVQHGQLLQESDIERIEDDYGRVIN